VSDEPHEHAPGGEAGARTFYGAARLESLFDEQTGQYFVPNIEPLDRAAVLAPPSGQGPLVAVVDTGLLFGHPLLKPRIAGAADFTGEGSADRDGHGTEVAIRIVLIAPDVRLLSAKVLAHDGAAVEVQAQRIADGINWGVEQGAREVNLCVGFVEACGPEHAPLSEAVREALDQDVWVFVAGEATCPAGCDPRVQAIGELTSTGEAVSNVPPTFVEGTWGRVKMVPWKQWAKPAIKEGEHVQH